MRALVTWVLVRPDIVPRPAVEASLLDVGNVVRNQVVAEPVPLVDGGPELAGIRVDVDADGVADAPGIQSLAAAVRVELEDVGAALFCRVVGDVGVRADGDEHPLAVFREHDISGPVAASPEAPAAGDIGDDHLRAAGCLRIPGPVPEAHDRAGVADIQILRVGAGRIERQSERLVQPIGEDAVELRLAVPIRVAQDAHAAGLALRHEQIAVGRGDDLARVVQAGGKLLDLEPGRSLRPGARRPRNDLRAIVHRAGLIGRGQVRRGDPPAHAGRVGRPVSHGRPTREDPTGRRRPAPGAHPRRDPGGRRLLVGGAPRAGTLEGETQSGSLGGKPCQGQPTAAPLATADHWLIPLTTPSPWFWRW